MLISAVVAEDHDLTRRGIESLLEDQLNARVPATTGDGLEVVPLLEEHTPDLLVLDLGLPGLNGLDVLRKIRDRGLSVQVVVLSMPSTARMWRLITEGTSVRLGTSTTATIS